MTQIPLKFRKSIIIFSCIAVLIGLYYIFMMRPFHEVWKESKAIMSGKLEPDEDHLLWGKYRLNRGEPYSLAAEVKLKIWRTYAWRWGNRGRMVVNYTQQYYDTEGKLLRENNGGEVWTLEKTDGKWKIVDVYVPNL